MKSSNKSYYIDPPLNRIVESPDFLIRLRKCDLEVEYRDRQLKYKIAYQNLYVKQFQTHGQLIESDQQVYNLAVDIFVKALLYLQFEYEERCKIIESKQLENDIDQMQQFITPSYENTLTIDTEIPVQENTLSFDFTPSSTTRRLQENTLSFDFLKTPSTKSFFDMQKSFLSTPSQTPFKKNNTPIGRHDKAQFTFTFQATMTAQLTYAQLNEFKEVCESLNLNQENITKGQIRILADKFKLDQTTVKTYLAGYFAFKNNKE